MRAAVNLLAINEQALGHTRSPVPAGGLRWPYYKVVKRLKENVENFIFFMLIKAAVIQL